MVGVLFICMGNICRSPLAEGVFRHQALARGLKEGPGLDFHCASAGTIGYHEGNPPDSRSIKVAKSKGIDISSQRSRKVQPGDFDDFDYIIPMDNDNIRSLYPVYESRHEPKISLLLSHANIVTKGGEGNTSEVPDPYYGGPEGFDHCLKLITLGTEGLLEKIIQKHFPGQY